MTRYLLKSVYMAAILGAALSANATTTSAQDYTFYFSGQCDDCGKTATPGVFGAGHASGVLKLKDYTLGDWMTSQNWDSFSFTSDKLGTLVSTQIIGNFSYSSGFSSIDAKHTWMGIRFEANDGHWYGLFTELPDNRFPQGKWSFAETGQPQLDYGFSYKWSNTAPVPEPETYAMLLAGLGLIGGIARRRKEPRQIA